MTDKAEINEQMANNTECIIPGRKLFGIFMIDVFDSDGTEIGGGLIPDFNGDRVAEVLVRWEMPVIVAKATDEMEQTLYNNQRVNFKDYCRLISETEKQSVRPADLNRKSILGFMGKTPEQIHYNMSRIRNKDTDIEFTLRRALWSRGLRYRKNVKGIEGKPDIVFIGRKVAVFCDSEFWHGYDWENTKDRIKTNRDFWIAKIERNIQRDGEVTRILEEQGWTVLRFWGKEIRKNTEKCVDTIEKEVRKNV